MIENEPAPPTTITAEVSPLPGFDVAVGKHREDRDRYRRWVFSLSWYLAWVSALVTANAVLFILVDLAVGWAVTR